jgi:hypothetical protein
VVADPDDFPWAPASPATVNPARYWRDTLAAHSLRANPPPAGVDPDEHFFTLMDQTFTDARRVLETGNDKERADASVAVYVSGLALLTYGRLDVLPHVLTHVPAEPSPLRALVSSVSALVPLPEWLSPRTDPAACMAWLEARWEALPWSEEDGRFLVVGESDPAR